MNEKKKMSTSKTVREIEEDTIYFYTKVLTVLSFAVIIIIVGLPLWWKTTETYKANLPLSRIEQLPHSQLFSTNVIVTIPSDFQEAVPNINRLLNEAHSEDTQNLIQCNVKTPTASEQEHLRESKSFKDVTKFLFSSGLLSDPGQIFVYVLTQNSVPFPISKKFYISRHRVIFVKLSSDIISLTKDMKKFIAETIIRQNNLNTVLANVISPQKIKPDKQTLWTIKTTPAYDITFSLIVPDPSEVKAQWDIEQGVAKFLQPMLEKLKPVATFNVQSQVLYYLSLGINPKYDQIKKWFFLIFEQLPHTINPLETKLGSHVSVNPSFNFLVYLPKKSESPLYIYDENGEPSRTNAFSSPRWGGIYIHNTQLAERNQSSPIPHIEIDTKKVMEVIISELRIFLGLNFPVSEGEIEYESMDSSCFSDWEMDYMLHKRTIENLATSVNTLKSLTGLLEEIGNIVINDEVGSYVTNAVEAIEKSQLLLRQGFLERAFQFSKEAFISSENAFFDPSMLALLYFPDDQKYAVYVPLFLPVSVPVILSLFQLYKAWKSRQAKKKLE